MSPRTDKPEPAAEPSRRLTLSQIVEQLLQRGSAEHSSITLARNAKGETQIEVIVRTDERGSITTLEDAETAAVQIYDRLRTKYAYGAGNGAGGEAS